MRLEKIIARSRVIDLHGADMKQALDELLTVSLSRFPDLKQDALLRGLIQRESTMTTYLGKGVALPHVRVKLGRRYILAIGRSQTGVHHDGTKSDEPARLILMLLADEKARDYLQVLTAIARLMDDEHFVKSLIDAPTLGDLHERLFAAFGGLTAPPQRAARQNRVNRMMMHEAGRVARGADCSAIMVFGDTFSGPVELRDWKAGMRSLLVTRALLDPAQFKGVFETIIQVRTFSKQRLAQLRSAILVAITRGVLNFTDRVCCLGGIAGSNQFDAVVVVDVGREFQTLLTRHTDLLPDDVKPEVLERVLGIAIELAVEGREGKPVGCLFVLGDTARVDTLTKPLVMNPFYGYKEEDRNILNPFMDETVKEFSSIDGAFVIRGDGVVMSAGSLIQASDNDHALPSGLGSRHAAAAAISVVAQCIAIAVSSSTGQVSLFRNGVMLPLMEKGKFSAI
ncbi:MAG: diadenylate cyclase [Opitutaceae bacterium]|jgi:DNA integrity scanning protein DisA with diadenylate cyclase activity/mannitol/fructose-specific phosphotransferase system IIA component (Ntr-type)|nr:diadenylate cyclase [Opitutaceae bacterium]